MRNDIKWYIFIIIVSLILVFSIVMILLINNNEKKIDELNKPNENTIVKNPKTNLSNPKSIDNLIVSNLEVKKSKIKTEIIGKITNNTFTDIDLNFVRVKVKDKDSKIITEIYTYIGIVRANSNREFIISTTENISNIFDVQFVK
ncbi:MAG: hypothetical protein RR290_04205 [Clostridia bacterium]